MSARAEPTGASFPASRCRLLPPDAPVRFEGGVKFARLSPEGQARLAKVFEEHGSVAGLHCPLGAGSVGSGGTSALVLPQEKTSQALRHQWFAVE